MSSGGGSNTTVQQADPWVGQQPYLRQGFQGALQNYMTPREFYPGATYIPFAQQTEQAMGMLQDRATNNPYSQATQQWTMGALGGPTTNPAVNTLSQTAQGQYLNANPYLDQMYDTAAGRMSERFNEAVLPGINATFGGMGRTGSGAHQQTLGNVAGEFGQELGALASDIYGSNYARERGLQQQAAQGLGDFQFRAASLAPTFNQMQLGDIQNLSRVGGAVESKAGEALQDAMSRWQFGQSEPDERLARYISAIQGNYGSQNVTSQDIQRNPWAGAIGGGITGATLGGAATGTGLANALGLGSTALGPWGALIGAGLGYMYG